MKLAWKVLVGLGVLLVFISMGMDTSVPFGEGRVTNLAMQAQQQMFLILGCVMFLAGIILFAVLKMKETPEQEAEAEKARQAAMEITKLRVEDLSAKADELGKVLSKVRAGTDGMPARLSIGILIGVLWAVYGGQLTYSSVFGLVLLVAVVIYSLWPQPWRAVISRLALANVVFLLVVYIALLISREVTLTTAAEGEFTLMTLLMFVLPIALSLGLFALLRRKQKFP